MTKKEFIKELRTMADNLEQDSFHIIQLEDGYIFANKNYGQVIIKVAKGVNLTVDLFLKEEKEV